MVARRRGRKEGRARYTCAARNAVDWVCFSLHSIAVELTWSACVLRERYTKTTKFSSEQEET